MRRAAGTKRVWLGDASLGVCDADDPPFTAGDLDPDSLLGFARPGQLVLLELIEPQQVELHIRQDGAPTTGDVVDVRSGRLFVGSTALLLDGEPILSAGEGLLLDVEPGRWLCRFTTASVGAASDGGAPDVRVDLHLHRVGEIGDPAAAPTVRSRSDRSAPARAWRLIAAAPDWTTERVRLRVPGTADAPPRLQVAFSQDGVEVERSEPVALWYRDGGWRYELWLVGPREQADGVQVWRLA